MKEPPERGWGARAFAALGRATVRHPWRFIALWVVLLVVTLPFLGHLNAVETNSTTALPANAPSSVAQAEFDRLFPRDVSAGSSSYLVFTGPNLTDANAQRTILNVAKALAGDPSLTAIASIDSVYSRYSAYLAGQLILGATGLQQAIAQGVPAEINKTAMVAWGVPAYFLGTWEGLIGENVSPPEANVLAHRDAEAHFANETLPLDVLGAFYTGAPPTPDAGFNGTADCAQYASNYSRVESCANAVVRANVPAVIDPTLPTPAGRALASAVFDTLAVGNFTNATSLRTTFAATLSPILGFPATWLLSTLEEFPTSVPSEGEALISANATVAAATLWTEPLPVPDSILSSYVARSGTAQIVKIGFTVPDGFTNRTGGTPVYSDIDAMNRLVPGIVARSAYPVDSIAFAQTGVGPLDLAEKSVVNESIALVLPITITVLLVVTALYFRSPLTPLIAFAGLAIAIVLALGGTVLLGTLVTHVDSTSLTLEEVFVLGVGTDYSIFLLSRYREERVAGAGSKEAIVTSVTWAGQSVATSGATAVIATLALTFSGVALLSQWGMVLSFAILMTILLSLTMIPAMLAIVGPRVFWPMTGPRFERFSARQRMHNESRSTYFYRAAAYTRRRPYTMIAILLLVSVPLIYVALNVPLSYNFYQQLPTSQFAVAGLATMNQHFGAGFAFPTTALVTFSSPLIVGNRTNASEFAELAELTSLAQATHGVALVQSLVGSYGAPLATWQNLSSQPIATQVNLEALASSLIGNDHRTILLSFQTNASGLSATALSALHGVEASFSRYAADHSNVTKLAYLGGAPITNDLAAQTSIATERLFIAVAIALLVVLLIVLRSAVLPVLAVATIGVSIAWAWALTYLVLGLGFGIGIFFYVPTLMFMLILGLGTDYNIFLLTRVREERIKGRSSREAVAEALARTGGVITAAALILAGAFASLMFGGFYLLVAIGFSVAIAVLLDATVVRTYFVPAVLQALHDHAWWLPGNRGDLASSPPNEGAEPPSATP